MTCCQVVATGLEVNVSLGQIDLSVQLKTDPLERCEHIGLEMYGIFRVIAFSTFPS